MQRLLIVEDDTDIAVAFRHLLSHAAIAIEVATNGVQAVARAREFRPHAILLDARLPAMDGFEVFLTLRRELGAATRVIFVTAQAPEGALLLAKELGAYACLKKPVSEDVLIQRVYEALGIPVPAGRKGTSRKVQVVRPPDDGEDTRPGGTKGREPAPAAAPRNLGDTARDVLAEG